MVVCAAAVFWIGLRRGWWLSLISNILKLINSKGTSKPQKKKRKGQHKKKDRNSKAGESEGGLEESGLVESPAAAEAGDVGAAAAAKALFTQMKTKMTSSKPGSADETAEREFWFPLCKTTLIAVKRIATPLLLLTCES